MHPLYRIIFLLTSVYEKQMGLDYSNSRTKKTYTIPYTMIYTNGIFWSFSRRSEAQSLWDAKWGRNVSPSAGTMSIFLIWRIKRPTNVSTFEPSSLAMEAKRRYKRDQRPWICSNKHDVADVEEGKECHSLPCGQGELWGFPNCLSYV